MIYYWCYCCWDLKVYCYCPKEYGLCYHYLKCLCLTDVPLFLIFYSSTYNLHLFVKKCLSYLFERYLFQLVSFDLKISFRFLLFHSSYSMIFTGCLRFEKAMDLLVEYMILSHSKKILMTSYYFVNCIYYRNQIEYFN